MDLQLEKYGLSFDIKKYSTSGWALGDENVIGIRFFKLIGQSWLVNGKFVTYSSPLSADFGTLSHLSFSPKLELCFEKEQPGTMEPVEEGRHNLPQITMHLVNKFGTILVSLHLLRWQMKPTGQNRAMMTLCP